MKTCQSSIKQSTGQQKGRKRYKMEGPKSWQTKKPPKRANHKGMGTNQVPKHPPLPHTKLREAYSKNFSQNFWSILRVSL
jgi:hypothetical protein